MSSSGATPGRVLITGASGFIGQALCRKLDQQKIEFLKVRRSKQPDGFNLREVAERLDQDAGSAKIDSVIHLAARAHILEDCATDSIAKFRRCNVLATQELARMALELGIRRFVYLSTVKVNGEGQVPAYTEQDAVHPQGAYALSKWEAEQALREIFKASAAELVIIRPPLVYGPGVKANFLNLLKTIDRGVPLPLASIHNRRSLIALENLVDFILTCLTHPFAANQTFLISDGEDLSTPQLIGRIAQHFDKTAPTFAFPKKCLKLLAVVAGKREVFERLAGSLWIDSSKANRLLAWKPPHSLDSQLRNTVDWYLRTYRPQQIDRGSRS